MRCGASKIMRIGEIRHLQRCARQVGALPGGVVHICKIKWTRVSRQHERAWPGMLPMLLTVVLLLASRDTCQAVAVATAEARRQAVEHIALAAAEARRQAVAHIALAAAPTAAAAQRGTHCMQRQARPGMRPATTHQ